MTIITKIFIVKALKEVKRSKEGRSEMLNIFLNIDELSQGIGTK